MTELRMYWIISMFFDRRIISQFSILLLQTIKPASSINDDALRLVLWEEIGLVVLFVLDSKWFIFDILVVVPQLFILSLQVLFGLHSVFNYICPTRSHLLLLSETYIIEFTSSIILNLQVHIIHITLLIVMFIKWTFRNVSEIQLLFQQFGFAFGVFIDARFCKLLVVIIIIVPSEQRLIFLTLPLVLFVVTQYYVLTLHFLIW